MLSQHGSLPGGSAYTAANWDSLGGDSLGALRCCQRISARLRDERSRVAEAAKSTNHQDTGSVTAAGGGTAPPSCTWILRAYCRVTCHFSNPMVQSSATSRCLKESTLLCFSHSSNVSAKLPCCKITCDCVVMLAFSEFGELLGPLAPAELLQRPVLALFCQHLSAELGPFPGEASPQDGESSQHQTSNQKHTSDSKTTDHIRCGTTPEQACKEEDPMVSLAYDAASAGAHTDPFAVHILPCRMLWICLHFASVFMPRVRFSTQSATPHSVKGSSSGSRPEWATPPFHTFVRPGGALLDATPHCSSTGAPSSRGRGRCC